MIDTKNTATVGRSTTRHIVTPNVFALSGLSEKGHAMRKYKVIHIRKGCAHVSYIRAINLDDAWSSVSDRKNIRSITPLFV